jgi:hypothetical protein
VFHDAAELVAENASGDAAVLADAGYTVVWQNRTVGFHRALVERDGQGVKIEWVFDSAFRFFPVVPDPLPATVCTTPISRSTRYSPVPVGS